MPSTPGYADIVPPGTNGISSLITPYLYAISFADIIIIGFTVWASSEMASNPVVGNWNAWRMLVVGETGLLFTFFLPQFILICRYINWNFTYLGGPGLTTLELSEAAGFIIMCCGEFLLYVNALLALRSPLVALPAAMNNTTMPATKTQDMQSVVVDKQTGQPVGVTNEAVNSGNYGEPVGSNANTEATVVSSADQSMYRQGTATNAI